MSFENKLPEWKNTGVEPSDTLKAAGFEAGNKPPASVFNWFWSNVIKAITEIQSKACLIVNAESTDGINYTATVPEITKLTAGRMIIFIPNMTTKTDSPTLNINGLGAISIRRKMSSGTATLTKGHLTTFFYANRPSILIYDTAVSNNKYWMAMEFTKPSATDLYGYVPVQNGGTYVNSSTTEEDIQEALANLKGVPQSRTINGLPLTDDITLGAQHIGITFGTAEPSGGKHGDIYIMYEE